METCSIFKVQKWCTSTIKIKCRRTVCVSAYQLNQLSSEKWDELGNNFGTKRKFLRFFFSILKSPDIALSLKN